jgi:hypothetical protein
MSVQPSVVAWLPPTWLTYQWQSVGTYTWPPEEAGRGPTTCTWENLRAETGMA